MPLKAAIGRIQQARCRECDRDLPLSIAVVDSNSPEPSSSLVALVECRCGVRWPLPLTRSTTWNS